MGILGVVLEHLRDRLWKQSFCAAIDVVFKQVDLSVPLDSECTPIAYVHYPT